MLFRFRSFEAHGVEQCPKGVLEWFEEFDRVLAQFDESIVGRVKCGAAAQ